jgi:hypothetical protein
MHHDAIGQLKVRTQVLIERHHTGVTESVVSRCGTLRRCGTANLNRNDLEDWVVVDYVYKRVDLIEEECIVSIVLIDYG